MAEEQKAKLRLQIAHVLFIDIVGYSKLLINQQSELQRELNEVVSSSNEFCEADAEGKLIRLPTGDGMALVFRTNPEAAAQCALEIGRALRQHPELQVRMGVHSGPVNEVADVNQRANIAGAGINMAQRVMDCGDAGHILLSKHVAEDLEQYDHWRPLLHDLGECEVKHGARIGVVNLYSNEAGNPHLPAKFEAMVKHRAHVRWAEVAIGLIVLGAIAAAFIFLWRRPMHSTLGVIEKSIAVLPFENLSSDKENAYFTDGVQDEILTNLARIADLKVISRTSVMQYKTGTPRNLREIGQQLGVVHVVEGAVQRAASKVRVNAQLIDARNDAHLWAQTYDRDLADVFAIQSEIAKTIADQLQAKLSPSEKKAIEQAPTSNVTAFDLYSRANDLFLTLSSGSAGRQNLLRAVDLLKQGLALDPSFFQAQCQLAYAHDQLYFYGYERTAEQLALADASVQAAFRLRPDAGEAHLARADHLYRGYLDYEGALAELEIARRALPNNPRIYQLTGAIARRQGKFEEGLRNYERALELDPRNYFILQQVALSYYIVSRYSDMVAAYDRCLAIKPDDLDTRSTRAQVELDWKGDTRSLHEMIKSIRTTNPAAIENVADAWLWCALAERDAAAAEAALAALGVNIFGSDALHFHKSFGAGLVARMTKDNEKARAAFSIARAEQEKIVQTQPDYGPALSVLGIIDAGLGRKEEALREGRRAIELLPVTKDALNGPHMIGGLAVIAAWVGEKELACEQLEQALRLHNYEVITYGQLKLSPFWDPLRGYPRFEKIVVDLAPKEGKK